MNESSDKKTGQTDIMKLIEVMNNPQHEVDIELPGADPATGSAKTDNNTDRR